MPSSNRGRMYCFAMFCHNARFQCPFWSAAPFDKQNNSNDSLFVPCLVLSFSSIWRTYEFNSEGPCRRSRRSRHSQSRLLIPCLAGDLIKSPSLMTEQGAWFSGPSFWASLVEGGRGRFKGQWSFARQDISLKLKCGDRSCCGGFFWWCSTKPLSELGYSVLVRLEITARRWVFFRRVYSNSKRGIIVDPSPGGASPTKPHRWCH